MARAQTQYRGVCNVIIAIKLNQPSSVQYSTDHPDIYISATDTVYIYTLILIILGLLSYFSALLSSTQLAN